MDDTTVSEQPPELEKVRRHVRILVELGRAAGETADLNRFLDQAVVRSRGPGRSAMLRCCGIAAGKRTCW